MKKLKEVLFLAIILTDIHLVHAQEKNRGDRLLNKAHDQNSVTVDSVVTRVRELSYSKEYINSYKAIAFDEANLKPHFIPDINSPLDRNSDKLKSLFDNKDETIKEIKKSLLQANKNPLAQKRMSVVFRDSLELQKLRFEQIPVYYLTANIYNFKQGENIAKYFNLQTNRKTFLAFNGKNLISLVDYYNKVARLIIPNRHLKENFIEISSISAQPIGIDLFIYDNPERTAANIFMWGAVVNDKLVFAFLDEMNKTIPVSAGKTENKYEKEFTLTLADAFFARENGYNIIQQFLDRQIEYYKRIKSLNLH